MENGAGIRPPQFCLFRYLLLLRNQPLTTEYSYAQPSTKAFSTSVQSA